MLIRHGDQDAATALYERYARRVLGLVESQLGAKMRANMEAEDVVQSVFRSIFQGVQAGNYDAPPGSTLWNLLAVVAVHKLRRRANHLSALRRDANRNVALDHTNQDALIDSASLEFFQLTVRETIERLSELDQQILSLRMENNTLDEICAIVGKSKRTIERRLQHIRNHLSEILLKDD